MSHPTALPPAGAWSARFDRLGILASSACGLHCVATAALLALSPTVWLSQRVYGIPVQWLVWLEWGLASTALVAGVLGLGGGWWHHRRWGPVVLGLVALVALGYALTSQLHWIPLWGPLSVIGCGLLLIASHRWNLSARRAHDRRLAQAAG